MSLSFLRSPDLGGPGQVKSVVDGQYMAVGQRKAKKYPTNLRLSWILLLRGWDLNLMISGL